MLWYRCPSCELKAEHFQNQEYVFRGHFPNDKNRVNTLHRNAPNYADAWDDSRGMMILDRENNAESNRYQLYRDCSNTEL